MPPRKEIVDYFEGLSGAQRKYVVMHRNKQLQESEQERVEKGLARRQHEFRKGLLAAGGLLLVGGLFYNWLLRVTRDEPMLSYQRNAIMKKDLEIEDLKNDNAHLARLLREARGQVEEVVEEESDPLWPQKDWSVPKLDRTQPAFERAPQTHIEPTADHFFRQR